MKTCIFLCCSLLLVQMGFAQQDSAGNNKLQFKIGVNYNSSLHYFGRTDSLSSTGFYPMAELWLGDSWYVNAAPIFVRNPVVGTEYAGTVATLGFLKATEHTVAHLYALKPFYTTESSLVQSALQGQAGASVTVLSSLANITVGGDAKFSDRIDFGAQASLDHLIRKEAGASVFIIDPTITVNAGTQHFLTTYRQKKGFILPREEVVTKQKTAFRLLAYELSVPVIYNRGQIQLLATPAYVVPQNIQAGEYGKPLAYISLGAKFTF
ncbi:hypothetical protein [Paracnuella aquatica]|uniref:hypothetical protein n=1 Tax=Paracnuella aquatica TaxID=2268757 RepID=UPI000F4F3CAD|nr:hypothetical protein [Paracnuella aquatica]RPD43820.1 hypothetical protein DRJ53_18715 [Paracnuella aquatica]